MKYVMFEIDHGETKQRVPIIFPTHLVHADIAEFISGMLQTKYAWEPKIVSAGEVDIGLDCICHGSSETLGISAQPDIDNRVISFNDYGAGFE